MNIIVCNNKEVELIPACQEIRCDTCPTCGSNAIKDGARLFCTNDECKGQALSRVMTWIKKRNILNLGVGIIKAAGIECIYDLYDTSEYKWANIKIKNGVLGEKRAKKIMDFLQKSKSVSLPEFLGSIGIKGVGRSLAADLCDWLKDTPNSELTLDDIFLLKANLIAKCEGFGQTRARDFCKYLKEHRQEIKDSACFLYFENHLDIQGGDGIFDGETICFTGKSPKTRPEMTALAESAGASVGSSVGANTTILVITDTNSMSAKAVKAREMGIRLVSPEDFLNEVGV
jgi:DNA ligase (NAD+)